MKLTRRGKLAIGVLVGFGFAALFYNDLILALIFIAIALSLFSELSWIIVVSKRPSSYFVLSSARAGVEPQKRSVALGEELEQDFFLTIKARCRISLSSAISYLKIIPREFDSKTRESKMLLKFRSPFAGVYHIEKIIVHILGPLRFLETDTSLAVSLEYSVYPKVYEVAVQSSKILGKSGIGEISTEFPGIGTEFFEMREYQPGDDIRQINWKATARLRELFVNEHAREVGAAYYLCLNTNASNYFDRDRLATTFLQIANLLTLLGANFGVFVHDGKKVTSFKEMDRPVSSLLFAMNIALDYIETGKDDIQSVEDTPPIPSHRMKSIGDLLSMRDLALLSRMEFFAQNQMLASIEGSEIFQTIMDKVSENPSEPPATLFISGLSSERSLIAPIIETSSELKRGYNADFIVIDPTASWVVSPSEEEASDIFETWVKRLRALNNSLVQCRVGDPIRIAEELFA